MDRVSRHNCDVLKLRNNAQFAKFRYQIIVSSKFRKGSGKFMIPIVLFKKFLSKLFLRVLKSATWPDAQAKLTG